MSSTLHPSSTEDSKCSSSTGFKRLHTARCSAFELFLTTELCFFSSADALFRSSRPSEIASLKSLQAWVTYEDAWLGMGFGLELDSAASSELKKARVRSLHITEVYPNLCMRLCNDDSLKRLKLSWGGKVTAERNFFGLCTSAKLSSALCALER